MKIRTGFVSNSSTSSFICDVCGEEYTGWDATPSEFDCDSCEDGHIWCRSHEWEDLKMTDEQMDECSKSGGGELPTEFCPICQFKVYSECEMAGYLEKTREVSRDEVFKKIKVMNKRRRKLYDSEYISHVCEKFELTDEILLDEIKSKFANHTEYYKFIKSK